MENSLKEQLFSVFYEKIILNNASNIAASLNAQDYLSYQYVEIGGIDNYSLYMMDSGSMVSFLYLLPGKAPIMLMSSSGSGTGYYSIGDCASFSRDALAIHDRTHSNDKTQCGPYRDCYVFYSGKGVNPYNGISYGIGGDRDTCYKVGYHCGYYNSFAWLFFLNMLMRGSNDAFLRGNAYSWTNGYFMGRSDKKNGYNCKF